MVKIAIAGGSGNVAREVTDAILATKRHDILLLSRKSPSDHATPGVTGIKVNYSDQDQLAGTLQGVDTVISFIVTNSDPGNVAQKNLIDAAVRAGVRRFAPSEWVGSSFDHMPWYTGKAEIREYLKQLNKHKTVLEYTLFQPGLFTDYLCYPHKSSKHVDTFETHIDFSNRRALMLEGSDDVRITLTTAGDLANVVARAIDYEGEWPVVGGIQGEELTIGQIIALGEKVRGGTFNVERLKTDELKVGVVQSSWLPRVNHPGLSPEQIKALATMLLPGMLFSISAGCMKVTDEWNQLLPDYKFTKTEEFLSAVWCDKL